MKILFLDLDGVLNSQRSCTAFGGYPMELHESCWDQVAVALIRRLCDAGVQCVLSSAWRKTHHFQRVAKAFRLPIIGATPSAPTGRRGEEIQEWLRENSAMGITHWAIVDDDADMLTGQMARFVQTSRDTGLSLQNFRDLCRILDVTPATGPLRDREWARQAGGLTWGES